MKRLICILLALPVLCQAQYLDEPTKKSTTIVVVLEGVSAEEAYRNVAHLFQDDGYLIENSDNVLYSLTTDWKKAPGFFVRYFQMSANVRQRGDVVEVHLKGKMKAEQMKATNLNQTQNVEMQIEKRHNMGKDWEMMMSMAQKLGNRFRYH